MYLDNKKIIILIFVIILIALIKFGGQGIINDFPDSNVPDDYYQPNGNTEDLINAMHEAGDHLLAYLPNSRSGLLTVVDIETGSILGSVKLGEFGKGPFNIVFTPDRVRFLCPFPKLDKVKMFDSDSFELVKEIGVGDFPVFIIGDDDYAYVYSEDSGVHVIDLGSLKVIRVVSMQEGPEDGVIAPNGYVYFTNDFGVTRINPDGSEVKQVVSMESEESQLAINKDGSVLYYAYCVDYESHYNLLLFDTSSWETLFELEEMTERPAPDGMVRSMIVTENDYLLYTDDDSSQVYTFDPASLRVINTVYAEIEGLHWGPQEIFSSPNGDYFCTLSSGGIAIEGGHVDIPSGLLVMDEDLNWIHEIQLGEYAGVNFMAFR